MRVRWTDAAARDLAGICDYTQQHHGQDAARKLALGIYAAIGSLQKFPHLGRLGRKPTTRDLVLSGIPFLVVYRLRDEAIDIVPILHGAQKWP